MASKSIRIRASHRDGVTTINTIIRHPMENGSRKDPRTGAIIPAHFIRQVICKHKGNVVLMCDWSRAVSKNPYLACQISGSKPGDEVSIYWLDTNGESDIARTVIK